MPMAPVDMLFVGIVMVGAAQALFLAALLPASPARRTPANLWLALMLAAFAANLSGDALEMAGAFATAPDLVLLQLWPIALMGPAARLHVAALLAGGRPPRPLLRHLAVPVLAALLMLPLALLPEGEAAALWTGGEMPAATGPVLAAVAGVAAALLLVLLHQLWCLWRAAGDLRAARGRADAADAARLAWAEVLLRVLAGLWALYALSLATGAMVEALAGAVLYVQYAATLAYTLSIYGLGGLALLRPGAFLPTPAAALARLAEPLAKYRRSALTEEDVGRLLRKLDALMRKEALWRDGSLTLQRLAQAVGASANDLSQAINQGEGVNFYDYVNRLRVEDAMRRLAQPGAPPVLEVALEVGFNSKSVFNAAFKRHAGTTPSAYRAEALKAAEGVAASAGTAGA